MNSERDHADALDPVEEAIFNAARDIANEALRASFLETACGGSEAARRRIEALLAGELAASQFLSGDPFGLEAGTALVETAPSVEEPTREIVGRYKLLEKIGEGGFGSVYVAEQKEPVRRRVALKVIKLGMDTRQVIARFEAERQALALMDHPNIAKVLDAGATDTGRPYFVMELVRGAPITAYCDENKLPARDRLKLFREVCHAIQHAHQKGIIHRDIKPSNILVTLNDGVAVPKVIDFGIAKATQGELTDKTVYTLFDQFIGTPAYISPEQAEMSSLDIDTRSDIYSLGVLLYELLVGQTPFDGQDLLRSGLDEMRRIIREKEPPRPSTRLTQMPGAELTTAAQRRSTDPMKLVNGLKGDLDWIVMKCLEKNRARRYETANGLAADISRHLNNEPVVARPPSTAYRIEKLVRRNKLAVIAAVICITVLILASAVSISQAVRAIHARNQARLSEQAARAAATLANDSLLTLSVANGVKYLNEDDPTAALLWFARSLEMVEGDPEKERIHRLRFASVLNESPRLAHLLEHESSVEYGAYSPDGRVIVTTSHFGKFRLWNANTGQPLTAPIDHDPAAPQANRVVHAAFSPDGRSVVTCAFIGGARVWDARTGEPITPQLLHTNWMAHAEFSPDGRKVVTSGFGNLAQIWDARTGEPLTPPLQHQGVVLTCSFSPDGERVLTASWEGAAQLWNARSGEPICPPMRHDGPAHSAAFTLDGIYALTAGLDGCIRFWDAHTGKETREPIRHPGRLRQMAVSPDGDRLVGSDGKEARVWRTATGALIGATADNHSQWAWSRFPLFDRTGRMIVVADTERSARVLDAETLEPLTPRLRHNFDINHAEFRPNGAELLTSGRDATARVWKIPARHPQSVQSLLLVNRVPHSPDGKRFVIGTSHETAQIFHSETGEALGAPLNLGGLLCYANFSADGRKLVTTSARGSDIRLWDAMTGVPLCAPLKIRAGGVESAPQFSANGLYLAAGCRQQLHVWNLTNYSLCGPPMPQSDFVEQLAFSPDNEFLAAGCSDGAARIWEVKSSTAITPILKHKGAIAHLAFSPDGRFLLTASLDRTVRVWDARMGEPITGFLQAGFLPRVAAFSPDTTEIWAAGTEGGVRWPFKPDDRPVEDMLLHAQVLAGRKIERSSGLALLTADETLQMWRKLTALPLPELSSEPLPAPAELLASRASGVQFRLLAPGAFNVSGEPLFLDLKADEALHDSRPSVIAGITPGVQQFGPTPFLIGRGVIEIAGNGSRRYGANLPANVSNIPVGRKGCLIHFLHGTRRLNRDEIPASYTIRFSDGIAWHLALTAQDIMEAGEDPRALNAKRSVPAVRVTNNWSAIQLLQTTWENPRPSHEIESIDYATENSWNNAFLIAITVE